MDNISALIKESKPLYFKRKKRAKILKYTCLSFVTVLLLSVGIITGNQFYADNSIASIDTEYSNSFIPTDEYGLIWIE